LGGTHNEMHGFTVPFSFPLHFTRGLWEPGNPLFAEVVRRLEPTRRQRVLMVIDGHLADARPQILAEIATYFDNYAEAIEMTGPAVVVAGGETVKNDLSHTLELLAEINGVGLDRQSFVAVVGGGAVLDMASCAAALAHRGIRVVRIPRTVLSQADSGVGVKNGINLFGKKNFIGTFVPPFAVINDRDLLASLSLRDRIAGVVEGIKVALLRDPALFEQIEADAARIAAGDLGVLQPVIRRSAELHLAHICGNGDPFELGSARPLDFGHWAAHKLESITHHRLRHGEAVAIGLALDITYSVRMGLLDRACAARVLTLLERIGFQLWDDALQLHDADGRSLLLAGLEEFREHLGGELHITLLRGIGDSCEVTEMDDSTVVEAVEELAVSHAAAFASVAR
jgi:3-dehydroquinate synthase